MGKRAAGSQTGSTAAWPDFPLDLAAPRRRRGPRQGEEVSPMQPHFVIAALAILAFLTAR
jgi:hypothetical protein